MDKKLKLWINILLYLLLFLVLLLTVNNNIDKENVLLLLSTLLLASVSSRYLYFYENEKVYNIGKINIIVEIMIAFGICGCDRYAVSVILFLIIIADAIIFYNMKFSIPVSITTYIAFFISRKLNLGQIYGAAFRAYLIIFSISIVLVVIVALFVKYLINQQNILTETMNELKAANQKLSDTAVELAELARLQERNRIATEVHDTVGHTLTTVLIEIEAGTLQIGKDNNEAVKKLDIALEQGRKGLAELRTSIGMIKQGNVHISRSLTNGLNKLLDETERYGNIKIVRKFDILSEISEEYKDIVIKSVREGITNSIRHGKCTEISLEVNENSNYVIIMLKDNGQGCGQINEGFGIQGIRQRIEKVNGRLELNSTEGSGFVIRMEIPIIN